MKKKNSLDNKNWNSNWPIILLYIYDKIII